MAAHRTSFRYLVPLSAWHNRSCDAHYQTVPHYYQGQRATNATGVDTDRLTRFAKDLKVRDTPVDRWVLPIASDQSELPQQKLWHRTTRVSKRTQPKP